ncbi:SpoIIE family protein phosphatase [Sporomusa acidovorans]|uniref:PAS domain-containing protein n=1 Tax=Sporomusa acidovorans (strain ATCC 49682 / DSM 3132 / Mol) TaxID=1123286 RepID=A0ABZ3IY72_SPOA4|nr:SpoIIE family protein phosphatase [Sporomusa acidovorans]OZC17629.1 phosphoserine phosphatase RsbU [Sporomusa acidovorans DSM 3132]SDE10005.1 PAS domain S-box-containing protein [Sporomusa acidovorans]
MSTREKPEMCEYCQRFDLLNMINDAILLVDAKTDAVIFMNHKALHMYRYGIQEVVGLSIMDLSHESRETVREKVEMVIEQEKRGYVFSANHVKGDGTLFKVEISARYLVMHGKPVIAALVRDAAIEDKMRQEVEVAGKIQRLLLPSDLETELFSLKTVYQPLHGLSGDLYDIQYDNNNQTLYGIILDVMGHGITATSQGGILRYLFRQAIEKHIAIGDKLAWINNEVMPFFSCGGFAAALLFAFNFKNKTMTYSSAGVSHFIRLSTKGARVIKSPGLFLGINENEAYDEGVLTFHAGDSFFFLTDGLFEMLAQPIARSHTFATMYELCKSLSTNKAIKDDASGVGIVIR